VLQVGLLMAKSGRLELGDNIYRHYRSIFNHCDVIGQQKQSNSVKTQNKGYYKVIEVGINRKPICDLVAYGLSIDTDLDVS